MGLYRRGLVYFDIPVSPDDRFSIPPLEGFVSNRTPTAGEAADPLEALLYSVFVASSESLKVGACVSNFKHWIQNSHTHHKRKAALIYSLFVASSKSLKVRDGTLNANLKLKHFTRSS